ncbi:C40 family peptidase [Streptomyces sp. NPDC001514]
MRIKHALAAAATGLVVTPAALGLGLVLIVPTLDDGAGRPATRGAMPLTQTLRIGEGGVPAQYVDLILKAAASCSEGLSPAILAAQLYQENGFNTTRVSPAGAQGIAQFMPGTWKTRGVDGNGDGRKDVNDPEDAIPAQARFMCALLKKAKAHPEYSGSPVELALAGYNAGWGRVQQYRGVPPKSFAEGQTYHYVQIIMATSANFAAPAPSTAPDVVNVGHDTLSEAPAQVRTAVSWALKAKGGWYQWGGSCTNPLGDTAAHRCDCSSLMQQAYAAAGISIPRTTYDQVNIGRRVDIDKPKPGDLVFNAGSDGSDARPGHVGMYIGDGLVIEAPRTGVQTRVVPYSNWRNSTSATTRVTEIRRVVDW